MIAKFSLRSNYCKLNDSGRLFQCGSDLFAVLVYIVMFCNAVWYFIQTLSITAIPYC